MEFSAFKEEIRQYLYNVCKDFSHDEIDIGLSERDNWLKGYLNTLDDYYDGDINKALNTAKKDFKLVFSKLTKDEFKEELIKKLKDTNEYKNLSKKLDLEKIFANDSRPLDINYEKALNNGDYYHALYYAFCDYYYTYLYWDI